MSGNAPSTGFHAPQTSVLQRGIGSISAVAPALEHWLEREREQLPLWVPVALIVGITLWFTLPRTADLMTVIIGLLALALTALLLGRGSRFGQVVAVGSILIVSGCLLIWAKALWVGSPPLARPAMATIVGAVGRIDVKAAQDIAQLRVTPEARPDLPSQVRINVPLDMMPSGLAKGDVISVKVRLMPPAEPAVPGAYDFARRAYFDGIGATGRAIGQISISQKRSSASERSLRQRLADHVRTQIDGGSGSLAVTLATGDRGDITSEDEEAMRRSSLSHLLSISGLHVTALIGAAMALTLKFLALSPTLALRLPLMLVAASVGAVAGIGYTLLTGAEVPTLRSCIGALLILAALAAGRDPLGLRTLATAAIIILIFWPEAAIGPSFQMSFAAVAALIALHESPIGRKLLARRDEAVWRKSGRFLLGLILSGLAVELALAPIALHHIHQTGLLGVVANLIAIPLTTFVIMPALAIALVLDLVSAGAPAWWVVDQALTALLSLAHAIAAQPMAVALAPASGTFWFGLAVLGLGWIILWRGRLRLVGGVPLTVGLLMMITVQPPDVLVTADGRHVAMRTANGDYALLRDRAGDYVRDILGEVTGEDSPMIALASLPDAKCNADVCSVVKTIEGQSTSFLLIRSQTLLRYNSLIAACATSDIVVADRRLPSGCQPRWLLLDRAFMSRSGGVALSLETRSILTAREAEDEHPWVIARHQRPQQRQAHRSPSAGVQDPSLQTKSAKNSRQ